MSDEPTQFHSVAKARAWDMAMAVVTESYELWSKLSSDPGLDEEQRRTFDAMATAADFILEKLSGRRLMADTTDPGC